MKASIRKQDDGCWRLTRPGYGFASEPAVTDHESWKAAKDAWLGLYPASAGSSIERGYFTLGMASKWGFSSRRGTIRMEDGT